MMTEKKLGPGDDLEMVTSPGKWPAWPVLPLVRRGGHEKECGFILDTGKPVVYLGNMFALHGAGSGALAKLPKREYPTYRDMLADGWLVD